MGTQISKQNLPYIKQEIQGDFIITYKKEIYQDHVAQYPTGGFIIHEIEYYKEIKREFTQEALRRMHKD